MWPPRADSFKRWLGSQPSTATIVEARLPTCHKKQMDYELQSDEENSTSPPRPQARPPLRENGLRRQSTRVERRPSSKPVDQAGHLYWDLATDPRSEVIPEQQFSDVAAESEPEGKQRRQWHSRKAVLDETRHDANRQREGASTERGGAPRLGEWHWGCLYGHRWLPNGLRLSCGPPAPQKRKMASIGHSDRGGASGPTASSAG